ncbi:MAG: hypothetical protein N2690_00685 [Rhodocyclaceae bacterium]|nr:hypothetical protein [Rhodocyclaceae bacterium]
MQGIPKILQTRADFDLALDLARRGEADSAAVARHFRGLIESAHYYAFDRVLADGEAPDGEPPQYLVIEPTADQPQRRQEKRTVDPSARLFQLGYTLAEVETIIHELEGA